MSWPRDRFGVSGTELITDPAQARPCLWRRRDHVYGVGALTEAQLGVGADVVAVHLDVERRVGFEPDPVEVVVAVEVAGFGRALGEEPGGEGDVAHHGGGGGGEQSEAGVEAGVGVGADFAVPR